MPGAEMGSSMNKKDGLLELRKFCVDSNEGRGIWKVIDEQRELLECLQTYAPEVLQRCPWLEGWLARTDMFLVNLVRLLGLPDTPAGMGRFPRPWPGSYVLKYAMPNKEFYNEQEQ